jgi:hypothetical protein
MKQVADERTRLSVRKYPSGMFRRRGKTDQTKNTGPAPAEVYLGLRDQLLTLDPTSVGLAGSLWGCVMETGYPKGTATLVCLSDGTTSLYTSTGGGFIGGGTHEAVVLENSKLLAFLGDNLAEMSPSADQSLPGEGRTIIRALTTDGQRTYEASENELGGDRSTMSPVFHAAHAVITQLRLIDEATR